MNGRDFSPACLLLLIIRSIISFNKQVVTYLTINLLLYYNALLGITIRPYYALYSSKGSRAILGNIKRF